MNNLISTVEDLIKKLEKLPKKKKIRVRDPHTGNLVSIIRLATNVPTVEIIIPQ